jgi:hypothetical protein
MWRESRIYKNIAYVGAPILASIAIGSFGGSVVGDILGSKQPVTHCTQPAGNFPKWAFDTQTQANAISRVAEALNVPERNVVAGLGGVALCDTQFTEKQITEKVLPATVTGISDTCLIFEQKGSTLPDGSVRSEVFCAIEDASS